jgi:hypothetical protein
MVKTLAYSSSRLHLNGWLMAFCFAIAEGGNLATSIYASSVLLESPKGTHIFFLTNAILYLSFALGTIISPSFVAFWGIKRGLVVGVFAYVFPPLAWLNPKLYLTIPANIIEGLFGAMLWTAVGQYYTTNAEHYATAKNLPVQSCVSYFANVFAGLFSLILALTKVLSGAIVQSSVAGQGPTLVFIFGVSLVVGGTVAMMCIIDFDKCGAVSHTYMQGRLPHQSNTEFVLSLKQSDSSSRMFQAEDEPESDSKTTSSRYQAHTTRGLLMSVLHLQFSDLKIKCHIPFNALFGTMASVAITLLTSAIKNSLGEAAVGYMWGVSGLYSFLFCILVSYVAFKPISVLIGIAAYLTLCVVLLFVSEVELNSMSALPLGILMAIYQTGFSVWSGTFSSVHAVNSHHLMSSVHTEILRYIFRIIIWALQSCRQRSQLTSFKADSRVVSLFSLLNTFPLRRNLPFVWYYQS